MRVMLRTAIFFFAALGAAAPVEAAPTFVVNSTFDIPASANVSDGICETGPGNGVCTLRAAIMEANAVVGGGAVIEVPAGTFMITRSGSGENAGLIGDFDLSAPMTISGRGPGVTILDAFQLDRVLDVGPSATDTTVRDLTVRRGDAKGFNGGGIQNAGGLTIRNVVVSDNTGFGGILNTGTLTIDRSVVEHNLGGGSLMSSAAGGVTNSFGTLEITDSLIRANLGQAAGGGGILNHGTARIDRTMVEGNDGTIGSGILLGAGSLTIVNSTLTRNFRSAALSTFPGTTAELIGVSIIHNASLENSVGFGGGIFVGGDATLVLRNSLVAGNVNLGLPLECSGFSPIFSGDYNRIGARSTCSLTGLLTHVNTSDFSFPTTPLTPTGGFGPDQGNVGLGINQIPEAFCTDELGAPLRVDQRGLSRDVLCDIGAIELGGAHQPSPLLDAQLIRNGGAQGNELGKTDGASVVQPPYWIASEPGSMTQIAYGLAGGYPLASEAPPASGSVFFGGGDTAFSGGSQEIDVTAIASQIDAGVIRFAVSGAFGGYLTNDDSATLTLTFQDAGRSDLASLSLGGFSAADRGNLTRLLADSKIGVVPSGTRFLDVRLTMTRTDGASNDGYADNVSLVLPEPSSGLTTLVGLAGLFGLASRRRSGSIETR